MGKKIKENFFPTGSREDRSWREWHLNEFLQTATEFLSEKNKTKQNKTKQKKSRQQCLKKELPKSITYKSQTFGKVPVVWQLDHSL